MRAPGQMLGSAVNRDISVGERRGQTHRLDRADLGVAMMGVGRELKLMGQKRDRGIAKRLEPDREERSRDLLAGRHQHVGLARMGRVAELCGELEQPIGLTRHRGDHDDDFIAACAHARDAIRHRSDPVNRTDRGSAIFVHD